MKSITETTAQIVEALCWDITLGFGQTAIGKMFIRATSSCPLNIPDSIDHVGLKAFGFLYEYGDCGILRTPIEDSSNPLSKYPAGKFRGGEVVGETTQTRQEFEEWIKEMNEDKYIGSKYDLVEHNCIGWAKEAASFLGVSYPSNWDKMISYAKANSFCANLLGGSIVSSRRISLEFDQFSANMNFQNEAFIQTPVVDMPVL